MNNNQEESKQQELMQGVGIFIVLAVLTGIEYFLGTHSSPVVFMWILAIVKAGLVMWFFMHIKRVYSDQGGH